MTAVDYFSNIFKEDLSVCIVDQLKVIENFLTYFDESQAEEVGREVSLEEVEEVLKDFARDKSPGPDGWSVELFWLFFDLVGRDLW